MSETAAVSAVTHTLHSGQAGNELAGAKEKRTRDSGGGKGKLEKSVRMCRTKGAYWYEKLLNLLQSVTHPGVGLSRRGEHLDEDVQVFVQVVIFRLAALP